jgi:RNA polymerase sigma-70 factor, ECF subfamily
MKPIKFELVQGSRSKESSLQPDESSLILSAQKGDTSAFKELYERYRERVYNLIYYSLENVEQAEDILQTVFVKVYKALPFFRLESGFMTWIYRVALNECKNRKRNRKFFVSLHAIEGSHEIHPAPAPDAIHETSELSNAVRDAIKSLKPKYRSVVVLKYLEEMSYEEVAETIGCSPGTVASRLYRALKILERRLARYGKRDGGEK